MFERIKMVATLVIFNAGGFFSSGGGVVRDFFGEGKILQVEFNVTLDKNHRCKKIL